MRAGWETKPLGKLCDFQRGLTYGKADEVDVSSNVVLRANNVDLATHTLDFSDLRYIAESVFVPASKKVRRGSLLICTASGSKSHLGKVAYVDDDYGYAFGGFMGQITPAAGLNGRFLFHVLTSRAYEEFIGALSDGVNINNLKFDDLRQFPVPVPELAEQRRIVAILDEAFDGIASAKANAEKNLRNAHDLFASALTKVFNNDWPQVRIEDACQSIIDCVNKTAPTVFEVTPFKMIRTTNVRNGAVSLASVNYVSEATYKVWTRRQVPLRGDVILTREAPMGEVGMLESDDLVFLGQRLVLYRADPTKLVGKFLLYALQSEPLQRQIHALASGSTVQHMRVPDSKNLQLSLPSLQRQREAVSMLDSMRDATTNLAGISSRKLAALDELKRSLLHQAFSGGLSSQNDQSTHGRALQMCTQ